MRDHEIELIAALVEGRLDDESEARAMIESSPELEAEYEAQKLAHDTLRSQGPVAMTETERAALHRDVWTALRGSTPPATRRTQRLLRWAPVAAGIFVVAGAVAVLSQAGGSDVAMTAEGVPEADTAETETAEPATLDDLDTVTEEAEDADEADIAADTSDGFELTEASRTFYAAEAAELRAGEAGATMSQAYRLADDQDLLQRCIDETELEGFVVLETRFVSEDEPLHDQIAPFIVAIPEGAELVTAPVAFIDLESCELLWLDE